MVFRIACAALILPDLVRPLPVFSSWPTAMAAADSASDMIVSLCLDRRINDPIRNRDELVAIAEFDPSDLPLRR
jgi:hypothetical protein